MPVGTAQAYRSAVGWSYFTNFIETDDFSQASVDNVAADRQIGISGGTGCVVIRGGEFNYGIWTLDGRLVASGDASNEVAVDMPLGVYIVKADGVCRKVVVR